MTNLNNADAKRHLSLKIKSKLVILSTLCLLLFSVLFAPDILNYAKDGLYLCFNVIIGSVFPFMILTDIIVATTHFERITWLRKSFEFLFKINGCAISAFIMGIFCGFPIGVKVALDLYKSGYISKDECERLIGFSNNTGPAFIISGIGAGMRGSISDGIILYISMLFSAIICGLILGRDKKASLIKLKKNKYHYDFSASIKSSALNTLYVCAFIVFFSIICGILKSAIKNDLIFSLIIPFAEISNSAKMLSKNDFLTQNFEMILTSFAISFSGISVHMQAKSFILGTDISMKTYYRAKLLQGTVSALITLFLIILI